MSATRSVEPPAKASPPRSSPSAVPAPAHEPRASDRWLRDSPGWVVSVAVHAVALLALLAFKFHAEARQQSSILSALEDIESSQHFEATTDDQVGTSEVVTSMAAVPSVATTIELSAAGAQQEIQQKVDEEFKAPDPGVTLTDDVAAPGVGELTGTVDLPGGSVENLAQSGGGVEGAIDRLTWEIMQSLRQSKTTVIWLFDQSKSLKDRRDSIADRFEIVYRQLESIDQEGRDSLQTVVGIYGQKFTLLTPKPVENVNPLIPQIRGIPDDPTGVENVFGAVNELVKRFRTERAKKRNVLIFVITDERGDDAEKHLEETILLCRRSGIRVYAVGNAAPFGRRKSMVKWTYDDGETVEVPIDSGPETVEPEALAMGFWGGRGPDLGRMSSGYGPYALTRLCKETGGLFFIAQETARFKFPPAVMRGYEPDYRPIRDYHAGLGKNKAKLGLVTAAKAVETVNGDGPFATIPLPRLEFHAYNDTVFRDQLDEAQKPAAVLTHDIDRILETLLLGEKDREKVTEPRWRAGYDLAIGRTLAMKVRAFGYNQMLADMKGQPLPFKNKDSNEWRIVPSKEVNAGQAVRKLEKQATMYLKRVVDEHPDTPWAMLAERELAIPQGWEWREARNPSLFAANTTPQEVRRQIQLAEDRARQNPPPKRQPTPQKERPKL